jgi:uncharacterized protein (TIGR03382 family)
VDVERQRMALRSTILLALLLLPLAVLGWRRKGRR